MHHTPRNSSDSKYTINMVSNIKEYKARKWKTKAKKDIANKDDVMDLYKY